MTPALVVGPEASTNPGRGAECGCAQPANIADIESSRIRLVWWTTSGGRSAYWSRETNAASEPVVSEGGEEVFWFNGDVPSARRPPRGPLLSECARTLPLVLGARHPSADLQAFDQRIFVRVLAGLVDRLLDGLDGKGGV